MEIMISRNSVIDFIRRNIIFLIILIAGAILWTWIFNTAAAEFLIGQERPFRSVWNGGGSIDLWGYTLNYEFEGWADHDYYYISWAEQFLHGYVPYTDQFNLIIVENTSYNTPYFFPPLYVYLCVIGKLIHPDFGIGFVISAFGFMTVFPVYGIADFLSGNRRVAEIASATYLVNPIVLYHTAFEWLNPAPFVFFSMLSFYLLMKNYRVSGTLAMVTSAFFKQTAFFFALPLIAFLIKVPPGKMQESSENTDEIKENEIKRRPKSDQVDLKGFMKMILIVVIYAVALSLPYIFDFSNYVHYVFQRMGATLLTNLTVTPAGNQPITLAVVFIVLGAPEWLTQAVNLMNYYSIGLLIGILPPLALMLLEEKDDENLKGYWRKIFFLSLLMMLGVHIFSPRGIYKYYTVALVPFISILSTSSICTKERKGIRASIVMVLNPLIITMAILVPNRNIYIFYLVLTTLAYIFHRQFSDTYDLVTSPFRNIGRRIKEIIRLSRRSELPLKAE
ncbi:MAG: hypothetical protein ACFE7R_03895 [Candidatus Hodarchaeota archaeon]